MENRYNMLLIAILMLSVKGVIAQPNKPKAPLLSDIVFENIPSLKSISKLNDMTAALESIDKQVQRATKKITANALNDGLLRDLILPNSVPLEFPIIEEIETPEPCGPAFEKTKKLSKTYPCDENTALSISNSYGRITVNTWQKNEFKIDIEIRGIDTNQEKADKLVNSVEISTSKVDNTAYFKTNIDNSNWKGNWLSSFWDNGEKGKVDVFYTVYMPSKNDIQLKTNYTNIIVPNLDGNVQINMNYGDLNAGKLTSAFNKISSNYGKIKITEINKANISANYGDISIQKADVINANLNYCSVLVNMLDFSGNFKMNYSGKFNINHLGADLSSLEVSSNYSQIALNFDDLENYDFDVTVSYASFKYNDADVKITSVSPSDDEKGWKPTKNYKGYSGKSGNAKITVKSNYGSVIFD